MQSDGYRRAAGGPQFRYSQGVVWIRFLGYGLVQHRRRAAVSADLVVEWRVAAVAAQQLLVEGGGIDLPTLSVLTGEDFVAISYQTAIDTALHLFRKDPARPAQWLASSDAGGTPTWRYPLESGPVSVLAGERFVLAVQMRQSQNNGTYDRITWNWTTRRWTRESFSTPTFSWLTAHRDYYAMLDMAGKVSLFHLDAALAWQTGATTSLQGFSGDDPGAVALAGGASMLVVAQQTAANSRQRSYDLFLLRWDEDYAFVPASRHSYEDRLDPLSPTSWIPTIISNTMVAVAGHLIRFDGQTWLENSNLIPDAIDPGTEQRYAYGADYAVLVLVSPGGSVEGRVVGFDPDAASSRWLSAPVAVSGLSVPSYHERTANWPAAGAGDYLAIGDQLFFRGTATDWSRVVSGSIADIQKLLGEGDRLQLNAASLINEGPNFLACSVFDSSAAGATRVVVMLLKNGNVEAAQMLDAQCMWTPLDSSSAGEGKYPGGPGMFAAFPTSSPDFDHAPSFFLHRYAGDAIQGNLSHYAVTSVTLEDGLSGSSVTTFRADPEQAACDPTGKVAKYFQTTMYPGGADTKAPQGSVVTTYLNGAAILTGENFHNSLDGMLSSVTTRSSSGVELSSVTHSYQVYTQRAGHPTDPSVPPKQLYGGYVLETAQMLVKDGVKSEKRISYVPDGLAAPYTGQPARTSTVTRNGAGVRETKLQNTTYACEVYETCRTLNYLTRPVQQLMTTDVGSGKVTTGVAATTLTGWPSRWGADVKVPAAEGDFGWIGGPPSFPFSSDAALRSPDGWQRTGRIEQRSADGLVLQHSDGEGSQVSTFAASTLGVPVATFQGAARAECAYNGFETYEDQRGWTSRGTRICTTDAHSGSASLCLPAASKASLSVAVAPASGRTAMVLGFWYKTAEGYAGLSAGWAIKAGSAEKAVRFADTGGRWIYTTVGIPLLAGAESVQATAANDGSKDVLLDGVLLMPLGTDLTARTYWHDKRLLAAVTDAGGRTTRTLYDRFNRSIGSVGPDDQLKELSVHFLSRQGSQADRFDDRSPNAELTLHPAGAGVAETFVDGGAWNSRWTAGQPAAWSISGGTLVHAKAGADSLRWTGWNDAPASAAFFAELWPVGKLSSPVSISFGGGQTITWTPGSGWSWKDASGNMVQTTLATPPAMATQWLLVLGSGIVLFFGDGQLLFSRQSAVTAAQGFSLNPGANDVEIPNLMAMTSPRLGISYTDGGARTRQVHQLHGSDSRVTEVLFDALDRGIATTRVAPGSFGKGSRSTTMQYRSTFVDVPAFLASLGSSWKMSGDVADYYAGQGDGPLPRSNDQGYPYRGTRYEDSSRKRPLEGGAPGLAYAIHDVDTLGPDQRSTARMRYGANTGADPLPPGEYYVRDAVSPSGHATRFMRDTMDRQVAAIQRDPKGNNTGQTQVSVAYSDTAGSTGATATLKLPNAFTTGPQSNPSGYMRSTFRDSLLQVTRVADSNTGATELVLDRKGKIRFVKTPLQPGERHFAYIKYDPIGRTLEEGFVTGDWNTGELEKKAAIAGWPAVADGATVVRVHRYDGDGNDPSALGKLVQVVTTNAAPVSDPSAGDCTITEDWKYDSSGRVHVAGLTVAGPVSHSSAVTYRYNNLNEVTEIETPSAGAITYQFDDQGHITGIGQSGAGPTSIAAYTYNAEGAVQTETRGAATGVSSYASPGWLLEHRVVIDRKTVFSLVNAHAPDGVLEHRKTTFAFPAASSLRSFTYEYDGQHRLSAARAADGKAAQEEVTLYDANGNIWAGAQQGAPFKATYVPGTDRLSTAALADGREASFRYRDDGRPEQWRGLTLEYDRGLGSLACALVPGGAPVRFARGHGGHRVLRQEGSSTRVTHFGAGDVPLLTWQGGSPEVCIWGPGGLVAVQGTTLRYPIKDGQGTIFAVIDAQGNLTARYDYLPFGGIIEQSGAEASSWRFHFMGKEFDATLGLYDFGARMYDPALRRFLTPDSARQYASPYVFVGNNPLNLTDPTGHLSKADRFGIGFAMAVVAIVGAVLTIVSAGTSDAAAASLEGALVAGEGVAEGIAESATVAAVETTSLVPVTVGNAALTAGQEALVAVTKNLVFMAVNSLGSSLISGGVSSGLYAYEHSNDFTAAGFGKAFGVGAAQGAIGGALGSLFAMPATAAYSGAWTVGAQVAMRSLGGGFCSFVASDLGAILNGRVNGQTPTTLGLVKTLLTSFALGAVGSFFSGSLALSPEANAVNKVEAFILSASTKINRALDNASGWPVSTKVAMGLYITGASLTTSYAVWATTAKE